MPPPVEEGIRLSSECTLDDKEDVEDEDVEDENALCHQRIACFSILNKYYTMHGYARLN